jgi:hypothetical protein
MAEIATDAAPVEVGTGTAVAAGGMSSPTETELPAIGSQHCVLALGRGCKLCDGSA